MTWTEEDKAFLRDSIEGLKAFIADKVEEQRKISRQIAHARLELACLEHCHEEVY